MPRTCHRLDRAYNRSASAIPKIDIKAKWNRDLKLMRNISDTNLHTRDRTQKVQTMLNFWQDQFRKASQVADGDAAFLEYDALAKWPMGRPEDTHRIHTRPSFEEIRGCAKWPTTEKYSTQILFRTTF